MRSGAHAFGYEALQFGLHGTVRGGHDVRTGLRPPGDTIELLCEQVRGRGEVSSPDELLLLLRQVAREALYTVREHPDTPIRNFDVRENVGGGEFRLLALRCLVRVRGECGDVDQPCDPVISSRSRDDASTVRVPDKNGRGDDPAQPAFYRGDVARESVEAVLGGDDLMPIRQ